MESKLRSEVRSVSSSTALVDDFCYLLQRERPFYAVVDGLNMAYKSNHFSISYVSYDWSIQSAVMIHCFFSS